MAATAVGAFGQDGHRHQWCAPTSTSPKPMHGKKRPAENSLETEQRLSKRLDLLNLDNHGPRLTPYVPTGGALGVPGHISQPKPPSSMTSTSTTRSRPPPDDTMEVEDTPHRIYIHDLAAELSDSDIESDTEHPIFLSDIEKHIAKIPKHVLTGPELRPTKDNQLILYQVPSSLTVPEEQDRVRRAIAEARARAREKQASPVTEPGFEDIRNRMMGTPPAPEPPEEDDPDAMDLD